MPIPDMSDDGLLPPGGHPATLDEVYERFVAPYHKSQRRKLIYDMWLHHRGALAHLIPIDEQWVDGSFVTNILEPGDIDVVSVLDGPAYDALSEPVQLLADSLLSGKYTRGYWRCDSIPIFRYPDDDPRHQIETDARQIYGDLFSSTKLDNQSKGYLIVNE
jgi:hypothetical protein